LSTQELKQARKTDKALYKAMIQDRKALARLKAVLQEMRVDVMSADDGQSIKNRLAQTDRHLKMYQSACERLEAYTQPLPPGELTALRDLLAETHVELNRDIGHLETYSVVMDQSCTKTLRKAMCKQLQAQQAQLTQLSRRTETLAQGPGHCTEDTVEHLASRMDGPMKRLGKAMSRHRELRGVALRLDRSWRGEALHSAVSMTSFRLAAEEVSTLMQRPEVLAASQKDPKLRRSLSEMQVRLQTVAHIQDSIQGCEERVDRCEFAVANLLAYTGAMPDTSLRSGQTRELNEVRADVKKQLAYVRKQKTSRLKGLAPAHRDQVKRLKQLLKLLDQAERSLQHKEVPSNLKR
jgi:hypothetical protein